MGSCKTVFVYDEYDIRIIIIIHVGQQSLEYRLFLDYYSKLVDTLPASDLSHYFVSDKIISLADHERIIRSTVPQDAAKLLLDKASLQLQKGNSTVLNKMLLIMDKYGVSAARATSVEIRKMLSAIKCGQGDMYIYCISCVI